MAKTLQFRRGTTSELSSVTGSVGELFVNTEKDTVVVMDGSTSGGFELTQNAATQTLTNKTLDATILTGTLTAGGGVGTSGQVLKSTGTGVEWGTVSAGGSADFSAVAEDILPSFDEVYDIGSSTSKWYDGFFTNSINIDTISLTNSSGTLSINSDVSITGDATLGSLLVDTLLLSENTITADASTALQYLGDKGVVEINNSNLDARDGDWFGVPVVESTTLTTTTSEEVPVYETTTSTSTDGPYYHPAAFGPQTDYFFGNYVFGLSSSYTPGLYFAELGTPFTSGFANMLSNIQAGSDLTMYQFDQVNGQFSTVTFTATGPATQSHTNKYADSSEWLVPGSITSMGNYVPSGGFETQIQNISLVVTTSTTTQTGTETQYTTTTTSIPPLTTGLEGMFRYNKDEGRFEGYTTEWSAIAGGISSPLVESPSGTYTLTGNLVVSGDITSSSDETLKENIKSIEGALDTVTKLSGKMFTMKSDETQKEKVGFIAQEIEQHLPQVVSTDPNGIKSVSYGNVAALLVEAIKELNQKIEDLKK